MFGLAAIFVFAGAALAAYGWIIRREENLLSSRTPTPIGSLGKEVAVITGVVEGSPFPTTAPLSGRECLYYEHKLQAMHSDVYQRQSWLQRTRYSQENYLATVHDVQIGGFFVNDGTGKAFIMPAEAKTDLLAHSEDKPLSFSEGGGEEREQERRIELGDKVCVLGTPRPFGEMMATIRRQGGQKIEAGMLQALLKLENEGADFPCFFAEGSDLFVAGRGYEDSLARLSGSSSGLATVGLLLAGIGSFLFIGFALGLF